MKEIVLVDHPEKYSGQFVATESFSSPKVISHGDNAQDVIKDAEEKGYSDSVIFYVPPEGTVHIY